MIFTLIKRLFCKHYKVIFWRNVYGDEINALNCRSVWECANCKAIVKSPYLHHSEGGANGQ